MLPTVPFYCIHLDTAKEREPAITRLEERLGRPLIRWNATKAADAIAQAKARGEGRRHPFGGITQGGNLGHVDSLIRLLKKMIAEKTPVIGIFEDDAELVAPVDEIQAFVSARAQWDILLLGANEWVDVSSAAGIVRVRRFWGTHALLLNQRAARAIIAMYARLTARGFAYPADWLLAEAVKEGLKVYGPANPKAYCIQSRGLVSLITGDVRQA
jgi:GR25 family glycosyltransferase involved in LPS biosynthesis